MTIGMYGYDPSNGPNPDFLQLIECKQNLSKELDIDPTKIELSMGMSNDYEQAVILTTIPYYCVCILFTYNLYMIK